MGCSREDVQPAIPFALSCPYFKREDVVAQVGGYF